MSTWRARAVSEGFLTEVRKAVYLPGAKGKATTFRFTDLAFLEALLSAAAAKGAA